MAGRSIFAAVWSASVLSLVSAAAISNRDLSGSLIARNDYPALPPCSYPYTPFTYVGCYVDPSTPARALEYSPQLDSSTMTVEECTASCKANGYRYAGLEYYGECFCGDSVNGPPAASESNCSYACTGNHAEICGGFDFVSVYMDPSFPPTNTATLTDYVSAGCYAEGTTGRGLEFQQSLSTATMTTEVCLQACKDQNYPLAATEFASQCFCGVVIANGALSADSSNCDMACNGNASEICGGASYFNLYVASDLEDPSPCGPTTAMTTMTSTTAAPTTTSTTTTTTSTTSTTTTTTSTTPTTTSTTSTTTTTTTTSTTPTTTSTTSTTSSTTSTTSSTTSTTPTSTSTTSTTSTTPTSTSTTSTSKTTTSTPTTITTMTTSTTKTTSTSTSSKCTSTAPAPTCEYKCGGWCSYPLPPFNDQPSCQKAHTSGKLQIADCFANAGWTYISQCMSYAQWCGNVETYCNAWSSKSSKGDCYSQNPPQGAPTTTAGVCTPTATSQPTTTTSATVCPPTATNVCVLPTGSSNSGYSNGECVGGIYPPIVTCNNQQSTFNSGPFKCYSSKDTTQCQSYGRNQVSKACQDACKIQYNSCMTTYAQSCKEQDGGNDGNNGNKNKKDKRGQGNGGNGQGDGGDGEGDGGNGQGDGGDSYASASQKCQNQYQDCLNANSNVWVSGSRCSSYNNGWS